MTKRITLVLALGFSLVSVGCASFQRNGAETINEVSVTPPEEGYEPSAKYGHVSTPENPAVQKWVNYFTGRGRKYMQVYLERSSRYIPMMKGVFRERGMPEELVYISLIESGFSPMAFSHASAVGYWQFIRDTGKRYNLKIDPYVDERRDPILSTQAAANYMDTLYGIFGDWHLALSAYNAGENRILKAVRNRKTNDFWALASMRRALPRETANYIPKWIAAIHIARNPEKYGFTNINPHPEFEYESVVFEKPISLELLAQNLNVDYEDLKRMNPRYKSDYVPVYTDRANAVRVPVGKAPAAILALENSYSDAPRRYIASFEFYKVRRGDTLSGIARKFRTSIAKLRDLNDWAGRKTFLRVGQRIKIPDGMPMRAEERKKAKSSDESSAIDAIETRSVASTSGHYIVQKGDTLIGIASRHGLSLGEIRKLNNLRNRSKVRVGEKLIVAKTTSSARSKRVAGMAVAKSSAEKSTQKIATSKAGKLVAKQTSRPARKPAAVDKRHVVRSGENLTSIAKRYRITVGEIAKANALTSRAKLFVGRSLVIPD